MNRINGLWGYTFTCFCLRWKQAKLFAFVETGFAAVLAKASVLILEAEGDAKVLLSGAGEVSKRIMD
mgnify:CR=1 FL=1